MKVNFFGPLGPTGYGIFTRYLTVAMAKQNIDVAVFPIYGGNIAEPDVMQLVNKVNDPTRLNVEIGIKLAIANPYDVLSFHAKKRIYYTMLEVDKIPEIWVKSLNTCDQVWTPSHWGKKVFEKSGVTKPVYVVPGGVDLNIFNPFRVPILPETDKFRFLAVGKWEIRKGYDILCKAFAEEFSKNEKVELILAAQSAKLFVRNFNIFEELFQLRLPSNRSTFSVIDFLPSYKDMGRLYTSVDCFVLPTRGEGWNLPLIEAMACGLPCIVTNWSGHTEYVNEKNCILLNDFKIEPAKHPKQIYSQYLEQGKWAEPSIKELRAKMRYAYDNQEEIKKIGKRAANDVKKWTWDEAAKKAKKVLKKL